MTQWHNSEIKMEFHKFDANYQQSSMYVRLPREMNKFKLRILVLYIYKLCLSQKTIFINSMKRRTY